MIRKEGRTLNTADKANGKFGVVVPVDIDSSMQKSAENPQEKSWYVRGYATTPDLDLQQDILLPTGIDISHFTEHGYINYEHEQGDDFKIGAPTKNSLVDDVGLFVEAKLYKNNPHAKSIWNLAKNIAESGIDRKLGFSIEGYAQQRNAKDPRVIEKAFITNVALTTQPANPNATWDAFMKSFLTGHGVTPETQTGAAALRAESFGRSLHNLSFAYKDIQDPDEFESVFREVGEYLDSMDRYSPESAVLFLQIAKGLSRKDAMTQVDKFVQMNSNN